MIALARFFENYWVTRKSFTKSPPKSTASMFQEASIEAGPLKPDTWIQRRVMCACDDLRIAEDSVVTEYLCHSIVVCHDAVVFVNLGFCVIVKKGVDSRED